MQYPLEDILDEYYLHVSEFILSTGSYNAVVLAGELEDLQRAKCILGKKISYRVVIEADVAYRSLLIEWRRVIVRLLTQSYKGIHQKLYYKNEGEPYEIVIIPNN